MGSVSVKWFSIALSLHSFNSLWLAGTWLTLSRGLAVVEGT